MTVEYIVRAENGIDWIVRPARHGCEILQELNGEPIGSVLLVRDSVRALRDALSLALGETTMVSEEPEVSLRALRLVKDCPWVKSVAGEYLPCVLPDGHEGGHLTARQVTAGKLHDARPGRWAETGAKEIDKAYGKDE